MSTHDHMQGGQKETISASQFVCLPSALSLRPDVKAVMNMYATTNSLGIPSMTAEQLREFLIHEQKIPESVATVDYCAALIAEVCLPVVTVAQAVTVMFLVSHDVQCTQSFPFIYSFFLCPSLLILKPSICHY